jgi:hypothetical protein
MSAAAVIAARENLIRQVLRLLSGEREEPHAHYDDEIDHAEELIALAARDLAEVTDALPEGKRPVGWNRSVPADLNVGDWVTVTLRFARVEGRLSYDESHQYLTLGHDAISEVFPLALTEHTSVTFLATEAELAAKARKPAGGAA